MNIWFLAFAINIIFFFLAWLGLSIYFRYMAPKKIFETGKSNIKLHIKHIHDVVKNKSGNKIDIVTLPKKNSNEVILYLHSSYGRLTNILTVARRFATVVSPAFPGYAESEGKPSTRRIYETVDRTMEYLHDKGYRDDQIVVLGHSMGGAAAVYAAVRYPNLKKVVLVNTFYSIQKLCNEVRYGFCLFTYDILNSGLIAPFAKAKIRQFHTKSDKVVPFEHGQKLFEKLGSTDKKFFEHSGTHRFFNVTNVLTQE